MSKHVVRLARGKLGFFDPLNRINLFYPHRMSAEVPENADLKYILRALRSGVIVDVNGTLWPTIHNENKDAGVIKAELNTPQEDSQKSVLEDNQEKIEDNQEKVEDNQGKEDNEDSVVEKIELPGGQITLTEEPDVEEQAPAEDAAEQEPEKVEDSLPEEADKENSKPKSKKKRK